MAKRAAARIGPTVCELDGPIPMENRSKTLITDIPASGWLAPASSRRRLRAYFLGVGVARIR
ncbi:hypothetical protein Aru02nite_46980 [Actinocatenispora rupis]|uniref:Uncharacterized protein n=1 Tax=Actinocatenispora rupis TaxID=519421 RepID=A0A8J3JBN8_9ACTN|nr:hypothetical protein Aru02nite_46980 [Actinocatenispora rupis]